MARLTGCWGAEFGVFGKDGVASDGGGTIAALSARTGNYGLSAKETVASVARGAQLLIGSSGTIVAGVQFDQRFRFHFRPITFPSTNGLWIGAFRNGPTCRIEMNTTGQLRRVDIFDVATAYAGSLSLGSWYRGELRVSGFGVASGGVNAITFSMAVYDEAGTLVTSSSGGSFTSGDGSITPSSQLALGQATGFDGVSCTREIDYDDVFYDVATGADAPIAAWPRSTKVYGFGVTGQGAFDQFTPAGGFANVDDIPPGSDFVSSSTAGNKTTYTHPPLAISTDEVECVSLGAFGPAGGFVKLLIGADEIQGFPNADNGLRASKAYLGAPLSGGSFAALEFGALIVSSFYQPGAFLMEALAGPPALNANAGPDQIVAALTTTLDGSASTPSSAVFLWTQLSGPTTAVFSNSASASPVITNLDMGVYVFRLSATNAGETKTDDVQITVNYPEMVWDDDDQTGELIGLSWNALALAPRQELQRLLAGDTAISLNDAPGFIVATLRDGDRSASLYLPSNADPSRARSQILAAARQLRETTAIDVPPHGGERYRLQAAYHEAGHMVAALALGMGVRRCTIVPGKCGRVVFGGETSYELPIPDPSPHRTLMLHAVVLRVGPLTPATLLGHPRELFNDADQRQIENILTLLKVADRDAAHDGLLAAARAFLDEARHASQIEAVACALLERRTITGHEAREICAANGLPVTLWQCPPLEELASSLVALDVVDL